MTQETTWVGLGEEGRNWLEGQFRLLADQSVRKVDRSGRVQVIREWSIALATLILESRRIEQGEVVVAAPQGLSLEALTRATSDIRRDAKSEILRRFLMGDRKQDSADDRSLCVIPSNSWNSSDLSSLRSTFQVSNHLKLVPHGASVYGLLTMGGTFRDRELIFDEAIADLSLSPPSIAVSGEGDFQSACETMQEAANVSDLTIAAVASSLTRIVAKGHLCGDFVIWILDT